MATENFTTFTESDPNNQLSETASTISFAVSRAANTYVYKDYGAAYFTVGSYFEFTFNVASTTGTTAKTWYLGYSNSLGSLLTIIGLSNQFAAFIHRIEATSSALYVGTQISAGGSTTSTALTKGNNYYSRCSLLSSLGQYGGFAAQTFSDSAFTTLVTARADALPAAASYQYLIGFNYTTGGSTDTMTGTDSDLTLSTGVVAAGIDLTTGVETDTGTGRLVVVADCIVATALNIANGEAAKHVAIDEGAGFFGDYTVSGVLNITSFSSTVGTEKRFNILCVTDAAADALAANDLQGIAIQNNTASVYTPYIHQAVAGADTFSTAGPNLNFNQPYSFTLSRSGTTLTMKVWNDLVLTNFVGASQVGSTVTWTSQATTTYRYLMPVASHLNGVTSKSATFTLGGVRISSDINGEFAGNVVTTATFVGAGSATNLYEATAVTTAVFVGASAWNGSLAATQVTTADFVGELYSAGSAPMSGTSVATASFVGASTWEGALAGTAVATCNFVADTTPSLTARISCRITKIGATGEVGATGLTPTLRFFQASNSYYRDFSDNAFKAIASVVTLTANMTEVNATLAPGRYYYTLQSYGLGTGAKMEYGYEIDATISATQTYMNEGSMIFLDGVEVLPGLTVVENLQVVTTTPAAIARVSQATTNKHVLNPADGTIKVYDDSGNLILSGLAYSDAAGTVLYNGTAAVHHTTRLT